MILVRLDRFAAGGDIEMESGSNVRLSVCGRRIGVCQRAETRGWVTNVMPPSLPPFSELEIPRYSYPAQAFDPNRVLSSFYFLINGWYDGVDAPRVGWYGRGAGDELGCRKPRSTADTAYSTKPTS